jgi:hypothetical protein
VGSIPVTRNAEMKELRLANRKNAYKKGIWKKSLLMLAVSQRLVVLWLG